MRPDGTPRPSASRWRSARAQSARAATGVRDAQEQASHPILAGIRFVAVELLIPRKLRARGPFTLAANRLQMQPGDARDRSVARRKYPKQRDALRQGEAGRAEDRFCRG